ncbi:DUF2254 domain-containing protein [Luteimonas vadosa]|uniref:DUF2254 domain-containing protein n=1 Tax=Luteimonas vadosa TaxID=1165507 RepID=A0ABP9E4G9_9GAMM
MALTGRWLYVLQRLTKRMWFRASLYCGLAVLTALVGVVVRPVLPPGLAGRFGADSVGNILSILATSMLAVTTFSLATMVSAYGTASQSATPRAANLLIEDNGAQIALATFIGAFLFSIAGLIALSTGIYGDGGRMVLFIASVLVIVVITVTLLRWIEQLSRFGRVGETINLVEAATRRAMHTRAKAPWMGGVPFEGPPPDGVPIEAPDVGYVEHLDMEQLERVAAAHGCNLHVLALPGTLAVPGRPLAIVTTALDEDGLKGVRDAFSIGDSRTFEHDPRYGLVVLNEVAVRALSPAVNDPGTCIDVISTIVRLFVEWSEARARHAGHAEVRFPHVHVPELEEADMYDDVFPSIAREGAHMREIGIKLQKAFIALSRLEYAPMRQPVARHSRETLARAMATMTFEPDRVDLQRTASQGAWATQVPEERPAADGTA